MTLNQIIAYAKRAGLSMDSELFIQQTTPEDWMEEDIEKLDYQEHGDECFKKCVTVGGYRKKQKLFLFIDDGLK